VRWLAELIDVERQGAAPAARPDAGASAQQPHPATRTTRPSRTTRPTTPT
jgi:hypothetical protein